jgi:hypothetical protein
MQRVEANNPEYARQQGTVLLRHTEGRICCGASVLLRQLKSWHTPCDGRPQTSQARVRIVKCSIGDSGDYLSPGRTARRSSVANRGLPGWRFIRSWQQAAVKGAPLAVISFDADHRRRIARRPGLPASVDGKHQRLAAGVKKLRLTVLYYTPFCGMAFTVGDIKRAHDTHPANQRVG